jgi:hypothetical protein
MDYGASVLRAAGVPVMYWNNGVEIIHPVSTYTIYSANLNTLYGSTNGTPIFVVDYCLLYDYDNYQVMDGQSRQLYDFNGFASVDFGTRTMFDSNLYYSIAFGNRQLIANDGVTTVMDWASTVKLRSGTSVSDNFINATSWLHVHRASGSEVFIKVSNTATGVIASDGFDLGITSTGIAQVRQRENLALEFLTNNAVRGTIAAAGTWGIGGTTAVGQLNVTSNADATPAILGERAVTAGNAFGAVFRNSSGTTGSVFIELQGRTSGAARNVHLRSDASGVFDLYTGSTTSGTLGTSRINVDAGGKVLISQGANVLRGAMATVYSQINSVGNIGVGEDTLHTVTIPASGFNQNGDSFEVKCAGIFAANANNKRVRLKFGSITLFDTTALAFNTGDWQIEARIFRTSTTTGRSIVTWTCSNVTLITTCDYQAWAFNFLTSNALFVTGEATADNDIVQELMQVFWVPVS